MRVDIGADLRIKAQCVEVHRYDADKPLHVVEQRLCAIVRHATGGAARHDYVWPTQLGVSGQYRVASAPGRRMYLERVDALTPTNSTVPSAAPTPAPSSSLAPLDLFGLALAKRVDESAEPLIKLFPAPAIAAGELEFADWFETYQ
jgi:hypothetical protein